MKRFTIPLLFILLFAWAPSACGSWGMGCLPAVAGSTILPMQLAAPPPRYEWREEDEDQILLYCNGRQLGNLLLETGEFFRHLPTGGFEKEPSEPPIAPPKRCACSRGCACQKGKRCNDKCVCPIQDGETIEPDGTPNFGLQLERIDEAPAHTINGQKATRTELLEALGTPGIPNDAGWLCLSAIGNTALGQLLQTDVSASPYLTFWKDRIKVKTFTPDHWAVRDMGYVEGVYLQNSEGKVLYRWDNYPGPAAIAEVLRVKDPSYDAAKDPPRVASAPSSTVFVWVGASLAILLFLALVCLFAAIGVWVFIRLVRPAAT